MKNLYIHKFLRLSFPHEHNDLALLAITVSPFVYRYMQICLYDLYPLLFILRIGRVNELISKITLLVVGGAWSRLKSELQMYVFS